MWLIINVTLILGGIGFLLAVALGIFFARRNKEQEAFFMNQTPPAIETVEESIEEPEQVFVKSMSEMLDNIPVIEEKQEVIEEPQSISNIFDKQEFITEELSETIEVAVEESELTYIVEVIEEPIEAPNEKAIEEQIEEIEANSLENKAVDKPVAITPPTKQAKPNINIQEQTLF